jgi:hypothetical protein
MEREQLLALVQPLLARLATLNASNPADATRVLAGFDVSGFEAGLRAYHSTGAATPREQGGVRFGRLAKASPETHGFSIDIVEMSGPAVGAHSHPNGEFDLSFALEGEPRFDGHAPGWLVYPPGSRHVPCVTGGRMLIAYFLPDGAIRFDPS